MAIGEFSERSGLSAKRLRTYAAEGLLAPAAVDPGSGYRYYSPGQLADARLIDALRRADVPLAAIRAFMRQPGPAQLEAWERQLRTDAHDRQRALALASHLVAASEDPLFPLVNPQSEEKLVTTLRTAGRTDIGRRRENNEDAIVSSDRLVLVADGMGGHPGGEIAANAAASVVPAVFTGRSVDELEAAVRAANWAIQDHAMAQPGLEGMGTTICRGGTPGGRARRPRPRRRQPGLFVARGRVAPADPGPQRHGRAHRARRAARGGGTSASPLRRSHPGARRRARCRDRSQHACRRRRGPNRRL